MVLKIAKAQLDLCYLSSFKKLGRTILAIMMLCIAIFIPMLLILPMFVTSIITTQPDVSSVVLPFIGLYIVLSIVTIILWTRFALIPYIALFEPNVPKMKLFKRNEQLLFAKDNSKWFTVKVRGLYVAIYITTSVVAGTIEYFTNELLGDILSLILITTLIFMHGILVMFYHNRVSSAKE